MSGRHIITMGYIPLDCKADRIVCGDPDSSGTSEITLIVEDEIISCLEKEGVVEPASPADWFNSKSRLWEDVVKNFASDLGGAAASIKPSTLGDCWSIFRDEAPGGKRGITQVAGEDDGGEFPNVSQGRNGNFYVRYQFEEDDEYFGEMVLMFDP